MDYKSRLKIFAFFIIAFLGIILRDTVFNQLSIAGGKPDFVLILTVFYAIFNGYKKGAIMGMSLGLLEDLMIGRFIGVNIICKGLIGIIFGSLQRSLYKDNFLVPLLCMLVASLLNSFVYFLVSAVIGGSFYFWDMAISAVPVALYTMCFAPLFYVIVYLMNRHKDETE